MERRIGCVLLLLLCCLSRGAFCEDVDVEVEEPTDTEPIKAKEEVAKTPVYRSPEPTGHAYLAENFDDREGFEQTWILSEAKKDDIDDDISKYDGEWAVELPDKNVLDGDMGLVLKSKARHAAISVPLNKPFFFKDKPLIVQYEVNFQQGQECGGAYMKLLTLDSEHSNLRLFHDKTPYSIMFGPDKCGNDHKLHFIFRHKNPLNGSMEEKHCKKPKERLEDFFSDKQSHLYTLILRPDNKFEVKVDGKIVNDGSLLDDFVPAVNPPLEIEDTQDSRPKDWDDREKIPDPKAQKPSDWDEDAPAQIVDEDDKMPYGWLENEPAMIANPDSVKPEDWDNEMDGEWEAPEIPNPKCAEAPGCGPYKQKMKKNPRYKGKWLPPLINNPNYKGKWKPKLVHNPNYFNDPYPFRMAPIFAVGFELWSMSPDIYFDNIIVTDDEQVAKQWADDSFEIRRSKIAAESATLWGRMMRHMNYKPGWWALYFIYLAIPITLYIWYLVRYYLKNNLWQSFLRYTTKHPWLWALFVVLLGIPICLIIYCCCLTTTQSKSESDGESAPDDKEPLAGTSDADAAISEESKNDNEEPDEEQESDEPDEGATVEEIEEEAVNETEELLTNEKEKPKDGPRRRKPNKE